ncbi:MAG: hypothetical protein SVT52_07060 [Planctomycetota bacterium]|nr:hypothetical protein [Planctomycetota bacterium]
MQVVCGQCGYRLKLDELKDDQGLRCPECGADISVPATDAAAQTEGQIKPDETSLGDKDAGFAEQAMRAMASKISITCGSCGKQLAVELRLAGRKRRCPACGNQIRIPYPEDDGEKPPTTPTTKTQQPDDESSTARRRATVRLILAACAATVVIVLVTAAGLKVARLFTGSGTPDKAGTEQAPATPPATQNSDRPDETPTIKPAAPMEPVAPTVQKGAEKTPDGQQPKTDLTHTIKILSTVAEAFATGNIFPAGPGRLYWKLTVEIKAGARPLRFRNYGEDVLLMVHGQRILSLGAPGGDGFLPTRSEKRTITLGRGESTRRTFLFELPQFVRNGELRIRDTAAVKVGPVSLPKLADAPVLEGEFNEIQPRYLKPMLRNPVMAAIQAAFGHSLIIRRRKASPAELAEGKQGGGLDVSIPAAMVTGQARSVGGGLYEAVLYHGQKSLNCKIRLVDSAQRLVLYLSDRPFHQLSYVRKK